MSNFSIFFRRALVFSFSLETLPGHLQVARLFHAAAEAETVHALNYLKAIRGVRGTRENLQEAISVESRAFKSVYPEMVETAKAEGNKEAEDFFRYAFETEKIHAELFQKLADALGSSGESVSYYVCPVCDHTAEKTSPGICPICGIKGPGYKKLSRGILPPWERRRPSPVAGYLSPGESIVFQITH